MLYFQQQQKYQLFIQNVDLRDKKKRPLLIRTLQSITD